jgi:hypothetical protein
MTNESSQATLTRVAPNSLPDWLSQIVLARAQPMP